MNEDRERDVVDLLRKSCPIPVPPGLKERVLRGAEKRRTERALISPLLRTCYILSTIVLIASLAVDTIVAHKEALRAESLFPSVTRTEESAEDTMLRTELYAAIPNMKYRTENRLRGREQGRKKRLSQSDGFDEMNLIEEEINGYKN